MRNSVTTAAVIIGLASLAMAGENAGVQTPVAQEPDRAKTACTEIAKLAERFSGLTVEASGGVVRDHMMDSNHDGCRVAAAGQDVGFRNNQWPHEALRSRMISGKWREEISRAGDGAGSTAFALRKGIVLCLWSAVWSTTELSEPEMPTAASYRFEVGCFEIDEAGSQPDPPREGDPDLS